ncbi:MAG: ATP synthase F1 subunit epsilon [Treponema sp.]|jgi:F-type H+-transporting ATPase subunit epsilon|nr:ATP synthase F1 subunit epsilon [Treponema sp.]
MAVLYTLEIYTPRRMFFSDSVEALTLVIADGEIGVYANHSRFTAPVKCSVAKIKDKKGVWKIAFIGDGIIEVKRHKTVLLTVAAEWPEEIDYERVLRSKKDAEEMLKSSHFQFERLAAKEKIRRADVRLKTCVAANIIPDSRTLNTSAS